MILKNASVPILGFAAFSGTGKTTLLLKILPLLQARGHNIGMVKHAHHTFEIDHVGKDSYALRKSGANQIIVASRTRWALICEHQDHGEPRLDELLCELKQDGLDLILVEGFKHEAFPKIEIHRPSLGFPLLYTNDANVIAVAHDDTLPAPTSLPELNLNDADQVAKFVIDYIHSNATGS